MRNGGGPILKATGPFTYWGAAEGGTLPRASSACRIYKLFIYAEKALRYLGEPFLYVLELANLNLDGIAGHA